MSVWAVTTVKNEADIIGATIAHLLAEGIERVFVYDGMSTDGTREVLAGFDQVTVWEDADPIHRQPKRMTELADLAVEQGAEWIIPFDADEFWCPTSPLSTIEEALNFLPASVTKVHAAMWQHKDWDWREPTHKPLGKVALRWRPGAKIRNGNHDVDALDGDTAFSVLHVREIQYRSFEHFLEKIEARCATLDPSLPESHGAHHTRLRHLSREDLAKEWRIMCERAITHDPIPSRCPPFAL